MYEGVLCVRALSSCVSHTDLMVDAEWCEAEMLEDESMSCVTPAVLPTSETFVFRNCAHKYRILPCFRQFLNRGAELVCEVLNVLSWQV